MNKQDHEKLNTETEKNDKAIIDALIGAVENEKKMENDQWWTDNEAEWKASGETQQELIRRILLEAYSCFARASTYAKRVGAHKEHLKRKKQLADVIRARNFFGRYWTQREQPLY